MFRMILRHGAFSDVLYEDSNTDEAQKVLEPKLEIQENAAGKLTFTVPPTNALYSKFGFVDGDNADNNTIDTWVDVYKENQMYWTGRIISRQVDFWRCVKVECEGLLGVLNDTVQPPYHYQNITPRSFLESLLTVHNGRVDDPDRMIFLGNVTVGTSALGSSHRYTNYETTLQCILEKLVQNVGGRIKLRYSRIGSGGRWFLDYLADYDELNSQTIQLGINLFEYSRSMTSAEYCTVVIPRGKQLETGPYEALTPYLTVASVNGGDIHVYLTAADYDGQVPGGRLPHEIYGNIEKVMDWSDIESASVLLRTAKTWLKDKQFADMQLEVGAMDLHYAGAQYQVIEIGNTVRVISPPHGMDRVFPVTKMEIKLDTPEDTIFTLGSTTSVSMTAMSSSSAAAIQEQFANIPTEQRITSIARQEATERIEHATTGYINIIQNEETGAQELVFSKTPNYRESVGIWRWTYNGLGWKPGLYGDDSEYTIAITNDGRINADFISTGTLIADIIKAGILTDQSGNNNFWFNLDTGEYSIRAIQDLIDGSVVYVTMSQFEQTASSINASVATVANGLAAAQSQININATNIESKVSLTDYTGAEIASKINQSATSVVIQAAHISLAGKTIALTSDNITIDSTYFKVSKTGAITATSGTIGGFTIDGTSIHTAGTGSSTTSSGAIYLSNASSGFTRAIGGTNRSNLRLAIGANFAVGATGALYATDAIISGTISSTNASITGGYFRVTTNNKDESHLTFNSGNWSTNVTADGMIVDSISGSGWKTTVRSYGIRTDNSSTEGGGTTSSYLIYGSLGMKRGGVKMVSIGESKNYVEKMLNAYGDLAHSGSTTFGDTKSAPVPSGIMTKVMSITFPSAGIWVVSAGVRFPTNSVGHRRAVLSKTSGGVNEVDYGNSFYMPAVNGYSTEGSICKVVTVSKSEVLYLNAYQNSGQSLNVGATIRAVQIA